MGTGGRPGGNFAGAPSPGGVYATRSFASSGPSLGALGAPPLVEWRARPNGSGPASLGKAATAVTRRKVLKRAMASLISFSALSSLLAAISLAVAAERLGGALVGVGRPSLDDGAVCGLPTVTQQVETLGAAGCGPQPATLALPWRVMSIISAWRRAVGDGMLAMGVVQTWRCTI